jgi:hypothetical protein
MCRGRRLPPARCRRAAPGHGGSEEIIDLVSGGLGVDEAAGADELASRTLDRGVRRRRSLSSGEYRFAHEENSETGMNKLFKTDQKGF